MSHEHFTRSKLEEFKAAGVLPLACYNGQVYVLLGAEKCRTGPGRDFGGQREACDLDAAATAGREFAEETLGLFAGCGVDAAAVQTSGSSMAHQLRSHTKCICVQHQLKKGQYHMFVAQTAFIEPIMFRLASEQNVATAAVAGAEKTDFAWVLLAELLRTVRACAPRYYHLSRACICSLPSHSRRPRWNLQLHPCFASSLRLAQSCGLNHLVAEVRQAAHLPLLSPPSPPLQQLTEEQADAARPEHMMYWLMQDGVVQQLLGQPPGQAIPEPAMQAGPECSDDHSGERSSESAGELQSLSPGQAPAQPEPWEHDAEGLGSADRDPVAAVN